jgi:predicted dehydrogenase
MTTDRVSRRQFLGTAAAAAAAFTIVPRRVLGGPGLTPPSETVYVAAIGAGGQAATDIQSCSDAGAKIVALCDVDDTRAADMFKRFPDAVKYRDFRKMLDQEKGVDAVIVGTPDHTHAVAAMAVLQRDKHVYCEKPLAHNLYEVRQLTQAARQHKVATQLGNQGHSFESMRLFREWVSDGAIGPVREVHVFCISSYGRADQLGKLEETHEVPGTLDWDLWLGPAAYRRYNPMYLPGSWRGWSAFGTGVIGDWTCHVLDPVFWTLDLGAPLTVTAEVGDYDPKAQGETFPRSMVVRYEFPARGDRPAVKITWYDGDRRPGRPPELEASRDLPKIGALVVGDKGTMMYGSHGADGVCILPQTKMREYLSHRPAKTLARSVGHHKEWLQACKDGKPSGSDFSYGGPLTEVALLGLVATRLPGRTLYWDAARLEFLNCPEANALIQAPYRDGWTLAKA